MKKERHRVEFMHYTYNTIGDVIIDWETVLSDLETSDFSDILEKTDKRIYNQYVDGYSIFEMTNRQHSKFINLLNLLILIPSGQSHKNY